MSHDSPSRSEIYGSFPTLGARLDDLDARLAAVPGSPIPTTISGGYVGVFAIIDHTSVEHIGIIDNHGVSISVPASAEHGDWRQLPLGTKILHATIPADEPDSEGCGFYTLDHIEGNNAVFLYDDPNPFLTNTSTLVGGFDFVTPDHQEGFSVSLFMASLWSVGFQGNTFVRTIPVGGYALEYAIANG